MRGPEVAVAQDHLARFKSALGKVEQMRREAEISSRVRAAIKTIRQAGREYSELEQRLKKLKRR
jgi:hypothetical protein